MEAVRQSLFVYRQSALMLQCSDVEPMLGELRKRLDPSAADGVPAHLNLLYPFTSRLSVEDPITTSRRAAIDRIWAICGKRKSSRA